MGRGGRMALCSQRSQRGKAEGMKRLQKLRNPQCVKFVSASGDGWLRSCLFCSLAVAVSLVLILHSCVSLCMNIAHLKVLETLIKSHAKFQPARSQQRLNVLCSCKSGSFPVTTTAESRISVAEPRRALSESLQLYNGG